MNRLSVLPVLALLLLAGVLPEGALKTAEAWELSDLPALGGETPADRAAFFEKTKKETTGITVGQGRRSLWVYFNPDCSYCHLLWNALDGVSDLTVIWIPVTFTPKGDSLARSAAILEAKDPARALKQNEDTFNDYREEGGYAISGRPSPHTEEAITRNTMLLQMWTGKIATPTLLYRNTRGGVGESVGLPADIPGMVATIATSP